MKFKPGQRVVCVQDDLCSLTAGYQYTIKGKGGSNISGGSMVCLKEAQGRRYSEDRFKAYMTNEERIATRKKEIANA